MKPFAGFPAGKVRLTPVPDLFFAELLTAIDDLAELKVTLFMFWFLYRQTGQPRYMTWAELASEGVLLGALRAAAITDWVDVVLVRINHAGVNMDGTFAQVVPLIEKLYAAGKAVYAMKVLGCGRLTDDMRKAIDYVLGLGTVHALTIGPTSFEQLEENVRLVGALAPQHPLK